jgi:hypothetical protein
MSDAAASHIPSQTASAQTGPGAPKRPLAHRVVDEARRYLAFAAYLVVVFGTLILFSLNIYTRLDQDTQHYSSYHFYALGLINALVLAKFMLVIEATRLGSLSLGRRLQQGPLVYEILYRAVLFAAVLTAAYVSEEVLVGVWHGRSLGEVLPEIAGGPRGLVTFAWVMVVALIPYFSLRAIERALGGTKLRALLLGTPVETEAPGR